MHKYSGTYSSGGTTVTQALQSRQALATLTETHGLAGTAVGLLYELTAPTDAQEPSKIDEILTALTAIAESQQQQVALLERVLRTLQPRPASNHG